MKEMQNNYSPYGEFLKDKYFVQCFDAVPSKMLLELPMEANKENMEAVLQALAVEVNQLEAVFKVWKTGGNKNAAADEDYPCQYLFKSSAKDLFIWVSLHYERLFIESYYNHADTALEEWLVLFCQDLRNTFGKEKQPTFKVLAKGGGQFFTEDISIKEFKVDVNELYNDDFFSIHEIIQASLKVDSSGLILLHGPPGTGKTSYIKSLLSNHNTRDFIFIPNDLVSELLQPEFVSFLIVNKNSILVIEDAEKVITSREHNSENSVVSTILQLTDGLFSDFLNIKIICTFNTSIDKVDKALLRKGRMIAFYEFKALAVGKANQLKSSLGFEEGESEMTLAEIFNLDKASFDQGRKTNTIGFKVGGN